MTDWQVVSAVLTALLVAQEWAHRRERKDLLNRLMVDKGHTEYLSDSKPRKAATTGSMIRTKAVKEGREEGR